MRAAEVENGLSAQSWQPQLAGQQQRWVHQAAQLPQIPLGQLPLTGDAAHAALCCTLSQATQLPGMLQAAAPAAS